MDKIDKTGYIFIVICVVIVMWMVALLVVSDANHGLCTMYGYNEVAINPITTKVTCVRSDRVLLEDLIRESK